ncbi:MAG: TolC family protein [Bacteroidales bacterium]|nr:TolC family protein [Bacteroidales bacterium]
MKNKVPIFNKLALLFSFILLLFMQQQLKAQTVETVTLHQAIQQTVNNHPLIKEAKNKVAIAQSQTEQQKTSLLPTVAANLSYTQVGPIPKVEFNGISFALGTPYNIDENIAVDYVIYDFDRRKDMIKVLQSTEATEAEKINVVKNSLAYETAKVYFSLIYLQKSITVINQEISDMEEHFSVAQKRVKTGTATGLDTLNTGVQLSVLQNQKLSIENQWNKTAVLLKSLMGLPIQSTINVDGNLEHSIQIYQVDTLIRRAYNLREELRINNLVLNTERLQKTLAEKTDMPVLAVHGSTGIKNGYPNNMLTPKVNYIVGLAAKIPIFDGHMRKLKINTANLNIESVIDHSTVLERNISTEVQTALLDYQNNKIQLKSAQQEIVQAQAALNQAKGLYKTGAITNTTLMDTETALSQARLKYTYQKYQLTLSHYKLLESTGQKIW